MDYIDIKKTEVKIVNGDKWQFQFRENGYVIVSMYRGGKGEGKKGKDVKSHWQRYLHGVNLEACLQYVYSSYNGNCEFLKYEELESD